MRWILLSAVVLMGGCVGETVPPTMSGAPALSTTPASPPWVADTGGEAPAACEGAPAPSPLDAEDLQDAIVANEAGDALPDLSEIANSTRTYDGRSYDRMEVHVTAYSRAGEPPWYVKIAGSFNGSGNDSYAFVVAEDGAIEQVVTQGGGAVPSDVAATLPEIVNASEEHRDILRSAPHPGPVSWSPSWPQCVRIAYTDNPPDMPPRFPHSTVHVYVVREAMAVAEDGVRSYPSGTAPPPE